MRTDLRGRGGFTLIELLTVIAIIGILAGLTAAGLTKAIAKARMTELHNRMHNVETLLYGYYTDNGTFPPAYGYVNPDVRDEDVDCGLDLTTTPDETPRENPACLNADLLPPYAGGADPTKSRPRYHFFLGSYMNELEEANNPDLYDPFSESYDTDRDGVISYMEYMPLEDRPVEDDDILYEDGTIGAKNNTAEVTELLKAEHRPFIYIPVNRRQAERIGNWYLANMNANNPVPDDATMVNPILQEEIANFASPQLYNQSDIPPAKYDAFVLISVGPQSNTDGLLRELTNMVDIVNNYPTQYRYHILGNVLYYLATRDADSNNKLDFDYDGRRDLKSSEKLYTFPDPDYANAPGPVILVSSH